MFVNNDFDNLINFMRMLLSSFLINGDIYDKVQ